MPSVTPEAILQEAGASADPASAWTSPLFPLAGVALRPTVMGCNEDGQFRRYVADEHGFANSRGFFESAHEIVLIGDSFTHGYCVDANLSYAARIRDRWPSALNLGIGGNGPLAELATLTEYAKHFRPQVVVWQYFGNDLTNLANERQHSLLPRYLDPGFSQGLSERQAEIDATIGEWVERVWAAGRERDLAERFRWRQVSTLFHLREIATTLRRGRSEQNDPFAELPMLRTILLRARDLVRAWGGRLLFVFVPEWERYYQPAALTGMDTRDAVLALVRSLDVPIVDLDESIRQHHDRPRLFARHELANAHFSPLGYDLMAREVIAGILRELGVSAPQPR
jgi:hypothetical protein